MVSELAPSRLLARAGDGLQLAQKRNPEGLDFHRVTFARSSRRKISVHPREMRWAPNESRIGVHADAIGRPEGVIFRDAVENGLNGTASVHNGGMKIRFNPRE